MALAAGTLVAGCANGGSGGASPDTPPLESARELLAEFENLVPHRRGGTEENAVAHRWLLERYRRARPPELTVDPFHFRNWQPTETRARVRGEGIDEDLDHVPLWFGGPSAFSGELVYLGPGAERDYPSRDVAGKAVLVDGNPLLSRTRAYAFAEAAGAAAFVSIGAAPDNLPQIYPVRCPAEPPGTIPAVGIGGEDGARLVNLLRDGPLTVDVSVEADVGRGTGWNIVARVPGTVDPDRQILMAAHYDAWFSGGADNGAGTITVLKILEHYARHPARHTITAVATDVEEWGLYGATVYVERNEDWRERTLAAFSIDTAVSTADALGTVGYTERSPMLGDLREARFTELYTAPLPLNLIQIFQGWLLGNDAQPFYWWGVQTSMAVALPPRYHTREDRSRFIDLDRFDLSIERYIEVIDRVDAREPDDYLVEELPRLDVAPGPVAAGEPVSVDVSFTTRGTGLPITGADVKCVVLHDDLVYQGEAPGLPQAPGEYTCDLPASAFFRSEIPFWIDVTGSQALAGKRERFVRVVVR